MQLYDNKHYISKLFNFYIALMEPCHFIERVTEKYKSLLQPVFIISCAKSNQAEGSIRYR